MTLAARDSSWGTRAYQKREGKNEGRHRKKSRYCLKLPLNAVSTYAQARGRGAVFRGFMVATGPANDKIYGRCMGLVAKLCAVSAAEAEAALLRAIYGVDELPAEVWARPRSAHIAQSVLPESCRDQAQTVLPVALLLAKGQSYATAREMLATEPRAGWRKHGC